PAATAFGVVVLFPSHLFLYGFLPAVVAVYWLLRPEARRWWLLASSAVFYGWTGWRFLARLAGMAAPTFLPVNLMDRDKLVARRLGLALACGNLLVLGIFKYLDLFAATLNALTEQMGLHPVASVLRLALPLGISYYTFNLLGYGLDVYRRRTEPARSFLDLLRYASFFPTVTSGPLMRYGDFSAQMGGDRRRPETDRLELGVFYFALGLSKKVVIADWIGQVTDPLWGNPQELGVWGAWLAVVSYHFRLYFDFSGYCDMAVGAAHLLGVQVPANFHAPYT